MEELVFEVVQESDGGYCAECLAEDIFTEGNSWNELRQNIRETVAAFFFDSSKHSLASQFQITVLSG